MDSNETFVIPRTIFPCFISSRGIVNSLKEVKPGVWIRENPNNGNIELLHPDNIEYHKFQTVKTFNET